MKNKKVAFGPGAASLILIVVVLGMCMLSVLTLISARNDEKLSARGAEMIERYYNLASMSEKSLGELDSLLVQAGADCADETEYLNNIREKLPERMQLNDREISWTEELNGSMMECAVKLAQLRETPRAEWIRHNMMTEE